MEPFIGQIMMFGGNFAIRGWAKCDGQLLAISSHSALFSILGTTYGGDGQSTFGLPDLRSRVPIHAGNGPGLANRSLGEKAGVENVTLSASQIPSHAHGVTINTSSSEGDTALPGDHILAKSGTGGYTTQATDSTLGGASSTNTGGSQSHTNVQPYLAVNFLIALEGVYPSRN